MCERVKWEAKVGINCRKYNAGQGMFKFDWRSCRVVCYTFASLCKNQQEELSSCWSKKIRLKTTKHIKSHFLGTLSFFFRLFLYLCCEKENTYCIKTLSFDDEMPLFCASLIGVVRLLSLFLYCSLRGCCSNKRRCLLFERLPR